MRYISWNTLVWRGKKGVLRQTPEVYFIKFSTYISLSFSEHKKGENNFEINMKLENVILILIFFMKYIDNLWTTKK